MPALAAFAALGLLVPPEGAWAAEAAAEIELRLALAVMPPWLAPEGRSSLHWAALQRFYKGRGYAPAWTDGSGPGPRAADLLDAVRAASTLGLEPGRYSPALAVVTAAVEDAPPWPTAVADGDLRLSYAFLRLAHDLLEGRLSPRGASGYWSAAPAAEADGVDLLQEAVEGQGPAAVLARLAPVHPQYAALLRALDAHRAIAAAGGWPQVPEPAAKRRRGSRDPRLAVVRRRLAISGDLPAAAAGGEADRPDAALAAALKRFQARHGLAADGRLGAATLAALNVPVEDRIAQIELSLERWRWLPRDLGPRYVLVNVPAFELHAVDGGRAAERMKVVTGRAFETPTPIFGAEMQTVTFSPWWNVPPRIAEEEIVPALRRSRGYLRRRGLLAVGAGRGLQFRQPPGPRNPMGWVKFVFPNPFNVYLHDTPDDAVFAAARRDVSHGCMRVERPLALARWALDDPAAWPDARIRAAMRSGTERSVPLARTLPVHVAYFTAWVEDDGTVRFLPDVYGHDEAQLALMRGESPWQRLAIAAANAAATP